jgi:predicted nucleotidyltransferase
MLHNKYFEVMKNFLNGYTKKVYGRELIGKIFLSQKNIALTLNELEKEGILIGNTSGNRKYYSLNLVNPILPFQIMNFENLKLLHFLEKNKRMIDFSKEVEGEIICVFGSYAKGLNKKDSDLDLFIIGKVDSLKVRKLGEKYDFDVQVFNVLSKDFERVVRENKGVFKEVLENHILLRGGEFFVKGVLKWLE